MRNVPKIPARAYRLMIATLIFLGISAISHAQNDNMSKTGPEARIEMIEKQIIFLNKRLDARDRENGRLWQVTPEAYEDSSDLQEIAYGIILISIIISFWYFLHNTNGDGKKKAVKISGSNPTDEIKNQEDEKKQKDRNENPSDPTPKQNYIIRGFAIFSLVMIVVMLATASWAALISFLGILGYLSHAYSRVLWPAFLFLKNKLDAEQTKASIPKITFADVGGLKNVVEEVKDVVDILSDPKEAERWNIEPPKGILLIGPPGTGKTLLANAIAGEAKIKIFTYVGSEFGTQFVRSGSREIKSVFQEARTSAPCIIFIDEIEAIGGRRGFDTSHEFDHATAQLLHEIDGFHRNKGVMLIAATNREGMLDEALLSRMGKKILVPPPDAKGREEILKIHTRKKELSPEINLAEIARRIPGFCGREIENVTNEASLCARRREQKRLGLFKKIFEVATNMLEKQNCTVISADFDEAILKTLVGLERTIEMLEEERRIVAHHELGHAIVASTQGFEILDRVTLMPRNWALGLTMISSAERHLMTKSMLLARITTLLGGRTAEEIYLGKDNVTTGAKDDLEKAGEIARQMICELGMGDSLINHRIDTPQLNQRPLSEYRASEIDKEIDGILKSCHARAVEIVRHNREKIEHLVEILLEKSVLEANEITGYLKKE
ncbi:MAG: AAA family ATPase [Candidatus Sungbacteria bacterium]|nr:AAA family ATPase [Candidatus Sungbacteria bacterium]